MKIYLIRALKKYLLTQIYANPTQIYADLSSEASATICVKSARIRVQKDSSRDFLNRKIKAQSSIEFSIAFVLAVLFLILTCNLFVWLNHNIVQRQREYEKTRTALPTNPKSMDFYATEGANKNPNYKPLNLFVPGGYK